MKTDINNIMYTVLKNNIYEIMDMTNNRSKEFFYIFQYLDESSKTYLLKHNKPSCFTSKCFVWDFLFKQKDQLKNWSSEEMLRNMDEYIKCNDEYYKDVVSLHFSYGMLLEETITVFSLIKYIFQNSSFLMHYDKENNNNYICSDSDIKYAYNNINNLKKKFSLDDIKNVYEYILKYRYKEDQILDYWSDNLLYTKNNITHTLLFIIMHAEYYFNNPNQLLDKFCSYAIHMRYKDFVTNIIYPGLTPYCSVYVYASLLINRCGNIMEEIIKSNKRNNKNNTQALNFNTQDNLKYKRDLVKNLILCILSKQDIQKGKKLEKFNDELIDYHLELCKKEGITLTTATITGKNCLEVCLGQRNPRGYEYDTIDYNETPIMLAVDNKYNPDFLDKYKIKITQYKNMYN